MNVKMDVKRFLMGTVAIAGLMVASCGGGNDGGGMRTDELREELVTLISAGFAGMTVDEQCVREAVGTLSDDDLRAIVAAGPDGDPAVSAEADAIGASLVECVTDFGDELDTSDTGPIPGGIEMTDSLIDLFVDQIEASGLQADRACLEQALAGIDVTQLAEVTNNSELMSTLTACIAP